ncbi:uncharacterized protein METZ01_LOCUS232629, partial [marine metagenome]
MARVNITRGPALISGVHPKSFLGGFIEGTTQDDVELIPGVGISFSHGGIIGQQT